MGLFSKTPAQKIRELEHQQELRQKHIKKWALELERIESSADDMKRRTELKTFIGHAEGEIEALAIRIEKLTK